MNSKRDLRVVKGITPDRVHLGEPENLPDRFARRAVGMKASEIRSLFAVASRPEIVSLAGGMPNLSALPMEMMASVVQKLIVENGSEAFSTAVAKDIPNFVSRSVM
jgi:hypothetical protein